MKTISTYKFLYEIISSWDKSIYSVLYEIIYALARASALEMTMETISIYNFLYDIISALARASALDKIIKTINFCMR